MTLLERIRDFSVFPGLWHKQVDHLRRAAANGDVDVVVAILRGRTPADPAKAQHTSALQMACRFGHLEAAKALLEKGADVNRIAPDGTALMEAAAAGREDIARLLLDSKADPCIGVDGDLPAHRAARFGHAAVLRLLDAQQGAAAGTLRAPNAEGRTPLMVACCMRDGGAEAAELLLARGADPCGADAAGNTCLHIAALAGNAELARLLLAAPGVRALASAPNARGRTPLHLAAAFGGEAAARELIAAGADARAADADGATPLHALAKSLMVSADSAAAVAELMLQRGADAGARDGQGRTALDYASLLPLRRVLGGGGPSTSSGAEEEGRRPAAVSRKEGVNASLRDVLQAEAAAAAAAGAATPSPADAFLLKEALRTRTSEEPEGWKLGSEVSTTQ
ncbi:hypothetical protein Rsub_00436 [Raphidocelis subcapitata]|uniref:Uncharacterized protein n=1 Tax=Raphidocelis subcapitata TaxID=307507 RepID=A0A2V0NSB0_9CHLO|nr:hypothetical protein Rsub_00436 [Raphidocelis subcapitata]|eukprot:GBF87725.1 hypothetical protein Rsub_00436 [Raphidocelis subcapitata]